MLAASEAFQQGNLTQAIQLYSGLIEGKKEHWLQAVLNRSSVYYTQTQYLHSYNDALLYLNSCDHPALQGYLLLGNCLGKLKKKLTAQERAVLERGREEYPQNKKYLSTVKMVEEVQVVEDEEELLERVFSKLLAEPKIRNWMQEEPFLTKVQKMIKNPSLACALIKLDPRLADVQEVILMAEE